MGWPKKREGPERSAAVRRAWARPVVARQARSIGEEMANRGAATMMRSRCWTMWSQNSSCW